MKRNIFILLVLIIVLCSLTGFAVAEEDTFLLDISREYIEIELVEGVGGINLCYEIDSINKRIKADKIRYQKNFLVIERDYENIYLNWDKINYLEIISKNKFEDEDFNILLENSSLHIKLDEGSPLNTSITVNGQTSGRKVSDIYLIEDFLLLKRQDYHIFIYPLHSIVEWSYRKDIEK